MRVKVIARKVPGVGSYGQEREIDGPSARALIALGKVVKAEEPKPEPKKTRTYKRRDVVAEVAAPVVEPAIKAVPVFARPVIDKPKLSEKTAKDDVFIGYPHERDE